MGCCTWQRLRGPEEKKPLPATEDADDISRLFIGSLYQQTNGKPIHFSDVRATIATTTNNGRRTVDIFGIDKTKQPGGYRYVPEINVWEVISSMD